MSNVTYKLAILKIETETEIFSKDAIQRSRLWEWEMDGTDSGSCPLAGFDITAVELSNCERLVKTFRRRLAVTQ
jgi:hypothetical protein